MPKTVKKQKKGVKKIKITFSRLNMTGVQVMEFTELKPDKTLIFEGEKYYILYKKVGKKEWYSKKQPLNFNPPPSKR